MTTSPSPTPQVLTVNTLLAALVALPDNERNAAFVEANGWSWPTALQQFNETRFEEMSDAEKTKDGTWRNMWQAIQLCTSEFGRSQAWWVLQLKRTPESHAEWFAKNGRSPVAAMAAA